MTSKTNLANYSTGIWSKSAEAGLYYHLVSASGTNATSVKTTTGWVTLIAGYNVSASPRYLKLYDLAAAPIVGSSTVALTFMMPGNSNGSGFNLVFDYSIEFVNGIAFAITGGMADSDTTSIGAADCVIDLVYN